MRVKQRNTFLGNRIWNSLAVRFEAITRWTGQAEIAQCRFAASGTGNDVLDLKSCDGESLQSSAVGTAVSKNPADLPP